jgi:hypothetical protein
VAASAAAAQQSIMKERKVMKKWHIERKIMTMKAKKMKAWRNIETGVSRKSGNEWRNGAASA